MVAVGASHRSGAEITLDNRAAWLRVELSEGEDSHVAEVLAAAQPQPVAPPWRGPRAASVLMGWLAQRMGSTLLVSNLGAVDGVDGLASVAFWPVSHGRSGVALGAASVNSETVITIRAPRRTFAALDADRLAEAVARELAG